MKNDIGIIRYFSDRRFLRCRSINDDMLHLGYHARYWGCTVTESAQSSIMITAIIEDDGPGKKRINVYLSPETAYLIQKYARLNGVSQGEIIESAVKESFFSARWGAGKWALRKP